MGNTSILLANEPRVYRETIAVAIGMLCPDKTVILADPGQMDDSIRKHHPRIVLCSKHTETLETEVPAWAILYPDGSADTIIQIRGQRRTIPSIELQGIVCLINKADETPPSPLN